MSTSPRLQLPFIAPSQAQKHVTLNDSLRKIDLMAQAKILSRATPAQPAAPNEGDIYILPANPAGPDWEHLSENMLAMFTDGYWDSLAPQIGFRVWNEETARVIIFDGVNWEPLQANLAPTDQLGVNTTADAVNRFAVKSDSELLSHDDVTPGSGDARKIINKKTSAHSASVVFQNAYQGRAEFGLLGDDDFALKTSVDGSQFDNSMVISQSRDVAELFHPLTVQGSPVMSLSDTPALMTRIASSNTYYGTDDRIDLISELDSHSGYNDALHEYVVPVSGIYMVQLGIVVRSASSSTTTVRLRLFKNGTDPQLASAVTADINVTTVNDAAIIDFSAGDVLHVEVILDDAAGTVRLFPSTRLLLYRIA